MPNRKSLTTQSINCPCSSSFLFSTRPASMIPSTLFFNAFRNRAVKTLIRPWLARLLCRRRFDVLRDVGQLVQRNAFKHGDRPVPRRYEKSGCGTPRASLFPNHSDAPRFRIIGTGSQACQRRRGVCEKSLLKSLVDPLRCPGSHGRQKRRFCPREYPKQDQIRFEVTGIAFLDLPVPCNPASHAPLVRAKGIRG